MAVRTIMGAILSGAIMNLILLEYISFSRRSAARWIFRVIRFLTPDLIPPMVGTNPLFLEAGACTSGMPPPGAGSDCGRKSAPWLRERERGESFCHIDLRRGEVLPSSLP